MVSYRGAQSLIDSRQNIDDTTQATTQGVGGNRFQQLYALNRASGQYYGQKKANELMSSGMAAEDAARRDMGKTGGGQYALGGITPESMMTAQRQQEQALAWSDPQARAGQIQKASGISPTEALYSSLYMGVGAGPLQDVRSRFGNLTQRLQEESAKVRASAEAGKNKPALDKYAPQTAESIAEWKRTHPTPDPKFPNSRQYGAQRVGEGQWSLKLPW